MYFVCKKGTTPEDFFEGLKDAARSRSLQYWNVALGVKGSGLNFDWTSLIGSGDLIVVNSSDSRMGAEQSRHFADQPEKDRHGAVLCFIELREILWREGDVVEAATMPVIYGENSVEVKWPDAAASARFGVSDRSYLLSYILSDKMKDSQVLRVEVDQMFLVDPETGTRWKQLR